MSLGISFTVNHPTQKRVQPVLPDSLRVSGLLSKTEAEDQILDGAAKIFPETKQKIHKENKQKYALEDLDKLGGGLCNQAEGTGILKSRFTNI